MAAPEMAAEAFSRRHPDLPRKGPGRDADLHGEVGRAGPTRIGTPLDAGFGPGGDIAALLASAPEPNILAIDSHAPVIDALTARIANDSGDTGRSGDMMAAEDPCHLTRCAGAILAIGVAETLQACRPDADPVLVAMLDEVEHEIATWRAHQADFGHLLCVAQPQ